MKTYELIPPDETIDEAAQIFKALANSHRLQIIALVIAKENICAKDLAGFLHLSQPDISYHLTRLNQVEILDKTKDGTRNCYHVNQATLEKVGLVPQIFINSNQEVS